LLLDGDGSECIGRLIFAFQSNPSIMHRFAVTDEV
jgi:hypothetical protein